VVALAGVVLAQWASRPRGASSPTAGAAVTAP
jgi:hypothetical protein